MKLIICYNLSYQNMNNPLSRINFTDPFICYDVDTKFYYAIASCPDNNMVIRRSHKVADVIDRGEKKIVYTCGSNEVFGPMWAPEMYKINDRWYIYTNCQAKYNENSFAERKTILVLKSKTSDPFDGFEFASKPDPAIFAIDPTIGFIDGKQYICYSEVNCEGHQVLVLREMSNPFTFTDNKAVIASASYPWEKVVGYDKYTINEGAFFVKNKDKIFIIYSANGCWSDDYCLGTLEYIGGNPCDPNSWKKHEEPLFKKGNNVFGVGHASFFTSPNGKELWCTYHCLEHSNPSLEPIKRITCIQKVAFTDSGYPFLGLPTSFDKSFNPPSEE